jgi:hypothetical protein
MNYSVSTNFSFIDADYIFANYTTSSNILVTDIGLQEMLQYGNIRASLRNIHAGTAHPCHSFGNLHAYQQNVGRENSWRKLLHLHI